MDRLFEDFRPHHMYVFFNNIFLYSIIQMLKSHQYDFHGAPSHCNDPKSPTWMYTRDVRAQQAGVPAVEAKPYPSRFKNKEGLSFNSPGCGEMGLL
jgi:hypothetical protein